MYLSVALLFEPRQHGGPAESQIPANPEYRQRVPLAATGFCIYPRGRDAQHGGHLFWRKNFGHSRRAANHQDYLFSL
jgi:hypothetical protein